MVGLTMEVTGGRGNHSHNWSVIVEASSTVVEEVLPLLRHGCFVGFSAINNIAVDNHAGHSCCVGAWRWWWQW